jgi:hypothetical protein
MGKRLVVELGKTTVTVALNETATAAALAAAVPFGGTAGRWGRELYFTTPVDGVEAEATAELVARGDVGYWLPGQALCLFFGPTPLSRGDEIRPASAVALVGVIEGGDTVLHALEAVLDGAAVQVRAAEPAAD